MLLGPVFHRHDCFVYTYLPLVMLMCVYFDVLALGKGGGEQVLVLFVCAGLNFCHTNLGYWAESAAPLSYNLSLNLKDSSGRQGT